ncbi:MAG: NADH-quinone oxidoreductase subunit J, partial [Candidatus Eremiobacteraeota bacterium]|nr:NADH-quinone oxidoreductase subunit J [Candidatus Eremiobacteraeota bacterium]
VTAQRPVYSVIGLLANFACLAVLFLTLSAEFLAVIQIIVYSGAILMLFLFVIALLSSGVRPFAAGPNRLPRIVFPLSLFAVVALGGILYVVTLRPEMIAPVTAAAGIGQPGAADVFGSVADFGKALFTTYLLPFEATAFVLMIAVIGVIALAGDDEPPRHVRRARPRTKTAQEAILREGRP